MTQRHRTMTSRLRAILGVERAYSWWFAPNPAFGNIEPSVLVRQDFTGEKNVYNFIAQRWEDHPFARYL